MPGKNLTRDEAVARAAIVSVDHYDVELDLTTGPEKTFRTRHHGHASRAASRAPPPSSTSSPSRWSRSRLNGADHRPGRRTSTASRIAAARPGRRERARRRRHRRATRTPARACTASSTRSTTRSTSTRSSRWPTAAACSPSSSSPTSRRPSRFTVTAPATGRSSPTPPRPRADRRRGDGRRATWAFEPTPRDLLLHHRARRRPVRRRPRRGADPQGRRCRSASSAAGR